MSGPPPKGDTLPYQSSLLISTWIYHRKARVGVRQIPSRGHTHLVGGRVSNQETQRAVRFDIIHPSGGEWLPGVSFSFSVFCEMMWYGTMSTPSPSWKRGGGKSATGEKWSSVGWGMKARLWGEWKPWWGGNSSSDRRKMVSNLAEYDVQRAWVWWYNNPSCKMLYRIKSRHERTQREAHMVEDHWSVDKGTFYHSAWTDV